MKRAIIAVAALIILGTHAEAQLSKADLDEANRMLKGTLYLRINLVCAHDWGDVSFWMRGTRWQTGLALKTLTEVGPTGSNVDLSQPRVADSLNRRGVVWWFLPNDAIRNAKVYKTDDGFLEIGAEGLPPKDLEVTIRLVGANNLDDFKAAFQRAFSRVPLQDDHAEWPPDVRKAIGERRPLLGMTAEQTYCVVGRPIEIRTSELDGKKVETWVLLQDIGRGMSLGEVQDVADDVTTDCTGFPVSLEFIDGRIASIGFVPAAADWNALSEKEQSEVEKMVEGTLYLRVNAVSNYHLEGRTVVSPGGSNLDMAVLPETFTENGAIWRYFPNDAIREAEIIWEDDGSVSVWAEGAPPKKGEVMVHLVGFMSMDEFKAAFNRAFSKVPLQDEHPEWPIEIRNAITERRVVEGMTAEQAYCVVGRPLGLSRRDDAGKQIETWLPPQEIGIGMSVEELKEVYADLKENRTGLPASIELIDGKVVSVTGAVK
ncbi:MAG: hypothetical protein AB1714_04815 [Acidobacteriota bacterium]